MKQTLFTLLLCWPAFMLAQQGLKVTNVEGTGRTTGYVITLTLENQSTVAQRIAPATYFIPSDGNYQPYVGRILQTIVIRPGETATVPIIGYCADIHLPPIPFGQSATPFNRWVAVTAASDIPSGMQLLSLQKANPWDVGKTPSASALSVTPGNTGELIPVWPGTKDEIGGHLDLRQDVATVGPLVVAILESIEENTFLHQNWDLLRTPFGSDPVLESVAVNQQVFWRVMAAYTGQQYSKADFLDRISRQLSAASTPLSDNDRNRLTNGLDDFWSAFARVALTAKVVLSGGGNEGDANLPSDDAGPCAALELRLVDLTFACRDGVCADQSRLVAAAQRAVNDAENARRLYPDEPERWETQLRESRETLTAVRNDFATCEAERRALCDEAQRIREERDACAGESRAWYQDGSQRIPPWDRVDLTNRLMKLTVLSSANTLADGVDDLTSKVSQDQIEESLPFWMPVAATIGASAGLFVLVRELENQPPPTFQINADSYVLDCGAQSAEIQPLENDIGDELSVLEIGTTSRATIVAQTDGSLLLTNLNSGEEFSFLLTVQDSTGQIGSANVSIAFTFPEINASADNYEVPFRGTLSGENVLANDQGEELRVTGHTQPNAGTVEIDDAGAIVYTAASDFFGQVQFSYTVQDRCGQERTAQVTITIPEPECEINATLDPVDTYCGYPRGGFGLEIDSAENYTFLWSDGSTAADLTGVLPGDYSVTITTVDSICSQEFSGTVAELTFNFINGSSTRPGNCLEGGGLLLSLSSPENQPFIVELTGPDIDESLLVNATTVDLGSFVELPPADYELLLYPEIAGPACGQPLSITVPDNQPPPVAVGDTLMTSYQTPVSANLLNNDTGFNLMLESAENVTGGSLGFNSDGNFTFTPNDGFSGTAGFMYMAQDACERMASAPVVITVEEPNCNIMASLVATNADCSFTNGGVELILESFGNYGYAWSNGHDGPDLGGIGAGEYTLTITDLDNETCQEILTATVFENPAEYVIDTFIFPAACTPLGDIDLTLAIPEGATMEINVVAPTGNFSFLIDEDFFELSDSIPVVPGDYIIRVQPAGSGAECRQILNLNVGTEIPVLTAINDTFETAFGMQLFANVLDNDSGLEISLLIAGNVIGGIVNFTPDGNFTFTPTVGFSGLASFEYAVSDACSNTAFAQAFIQVAPPAWDPDRPQFRGGITTLPGLVVPGPREMPGVAWQPGGGQALPSLFGELSRTNRQGRMALLRFESGSTPGFGRHVLLSAQMGERVVSDLGEWQLSAGPLRQFSHRSLVNGGGFADQQWGWMIDAGWQPIWINGLNLQARLLFDELNLLPRVFAFGFQYETRF